MIPARTLQEQLADLVHVVGTADELELELPQIVSTSAPSVTADPRSAPGDAGDFHPPRMQDLAELETFAPFAELLMAQPAPVVQLAPPTVQPAPPPAVQSAPFHAPAYPHSTVQPAQCFSGASQRPSMLNPQSPFAPTSQSCGAGPTAHHGAGGGYGGGCGVSGSSGCGGGYGGGGGGSYGSGGGRNGCGSGCGGGGGGCGGGGGGYGGGGGGSGSGGADSGDRQEASPYP